MYDVLSFSYSLFLLFCRGVHCGAVIEGRRFNGRQRQGFQRIYKVRRARGATINYIVVTSKQTIQFNSGGLLTSFNNTPLVTQTLSTTRAPTLTTQIIIAHSPRITRLTYGTNVGAVLRDLPNQGSAIRLNLRTLLSRLPNLTKYVFLPKSRPLLQGRDLRTVTHSLSTLSRGRQTVLQLNFHTRSNARQLKDPILFKDDCFNALYSLPRNGNNNIIVHQRPRSIQTMCTTRRRRLRSTSAMRRLRQLQELLWVLSRGGTTPTTTTDYAPKQHVAVAKMPLLELPY